MLRLFVLFIGLIILVSCGVSTSSSAQKIIDTQPSETPITNDDNSTNIDVNDSVVVDGPQPGDDDFTSIFDAQDSAIFDEGSCDSSLANFTTLLQDSANTFLGNKDEVNGISVTSFYAETVSELDSLVTLYYSRLPVGTQLTDNETSFYGDDSQFRVTYDLAWLEVENNVMYVKTSNGLLNKPNCFKIILDSEQGTAIPAQKVYR